MPEHPKHNNETCSDLPHNLFYVSSENIEHDNITVAGASFHHLKNVLRKKPGAIIFITDGQGMRYKTKILQITKSVIKTKILQKEAVKSAIIIDVELAFVPLKGNRNDFIIEKGTELGIRKFLPFISESAVVKDLSQTKLRHLKNVATSALLQSQQCFLPEIIFQKDLNTLVARFKDYDLILIADQEGRSEISTDAQSLLFIVGPEGGFSRSEIEMFKNAGGHPFVLGPNRLRSETAAICGIGKILTLYKQF